MQNIGADQRLLNKDHVEHLEFSVRILVLSRRISVRFAPRRMAAVTEPSTWSAASMLHMVLVFSS